MAVSGRAGGLLRPRRGRTPACEPGVCRQTPRRVHVPLLLQLGATEVIQHTSGALDLQDTLFPSIILEGADERGSDGEDGPLTVCRRLRLGSRRQRAVDDVLVAAGDVGPVGGGVE